LLNKTFFPPGQHSKIASEGNILKLECPSKSSDSPNTNNNNSLIIINQINIIKSTKTSSSSSKNNKNYSLLKVCDNEDDINLNKIKLKCQYKTQCILLVSRQLFKLFEKECSGDFKYIEVNFECIPGSIIV
jgi:hypothetical protein